MNCQGISGAARRLKSGIGKTYGQMAREIGVSLSTFEGYRKGRIQPPAWRIRRIREVLGLRQEGELFRDSPALSFVGVCGIPTFVDNFVFSHRSDRIAVSDLAGGIHSFRITGEGIRAHLSRELEAGFSTLQFDRTGSLLALTYNYETCLYLWDVYMDSAIARIEKFGPFNAVSPDGHYLACVSSSSVLHVYQSVLQGCSLAERAYLSFRECAQLRLDSYDTSFRPVEVIFSHDNSTVLLYGRKGEIYLYRWPSSSRLRAFSREEIGNRHNAKFSPDDALLSTSTSGAQYLDRYFGYLVRIWDIESGSRIREMITASPAAFLYGNKKKYLMYCSLFGTLEIEDIYTGRRISNYALPYFDVSSLDHIYSIEVSSDGNLIAIAYNKDSPEKSEEAHVIVLAVDWS